MLNSIREYGLERLTEAGETAAMAERHARFYAAFIRELTPLVHALDDVAWSRRVALEIDNLRPAIEWTLLREHAPAIGLALLADLEWPELVATPQEALRWYESAAARADAMPDAIVHARILRHCVVLDNLVGAAPAKLEAVALRAVEAARGSGDANELARALATLGAAYRTAGRFDEAGNALAQAYQTPERLTPLTRNAVLRLWAVTDLQRGEVELARRRFSEVARLERPGSEAHASALLNLGELEFASGHAASARDAALQAKETYARLHSVHLVLLLANLAAYAIAENDLDQAREHLREALQIVRRSGSGSGIAVLEHHAHLAALLGDRERAVVLVGYTDAHYVARGEIRQRTERWGHERLMALLAETYAADERERRMREGARLTPEQAITWAAAIHEPTNDSAAMPPKG
jgi:tetratricopeptide (TPR) repeat protein